MTVSEATRTLEVPGATLTYDVRSGGSAGDPALFLIGSPMGAAGFGTLAGFFTDRRVVTYDPRGVERSEKADPASPTTPDPLRPRSSWPPVGSRTARWRTAVPSPSRSGSERSR